MSTPDKTTPDFAGLRKAVKAFQPKPSRIPFLHLKPVHDSIAQLRQQQVSCAAIADLLRQHGVQTSRARVAEYVRIVLNGGKSRKRRKTAPVVAVPATPQSAAITGAKPALASQAIHAPLAQG